MKQKLSLSLEKRVVDDIDSKRGLIPRSTYIEYLLKQKGEVHEE